MKRQTSARTLLWLGAFWVNRGHEGKSKRAKNSALTFRDLQRRAFYRPLAVAMSVLLLPALSWWEGGAGVRPFQASAQQLQTYPCTPSPQNAIVQSYCSTVAVNFGDLNTLESDAVNAYLAAHELPAGDAHVIYDYGRSDLRSAIRADMLTTMLTIISKPASQRTAHEQFLYTWLQTLVQRNEISLYQAATKAYQSWQNDPCDFTLDPDIAKQYGLSYNGTPFCFLSLTQGVAQPPVPAPSYFKAYGLKQSYGAPASQFPYFASLANNTGLGVGEMAGISLASGAVVATAVGAALFASFSAAVASVGSTTAIGLATASSAFALSVPAIEALGGAALAVAGPVGIVLGAIAIGVAAGLQDYNQGVEQQQIASFLNTLNQVTATPPDLIAFTDTLGMYKLETTLASQTLPEVASTAILPAHRPGTDPGFGISSAGGGTIPVDNLTYQDWGGVTWSAQTWGGWFVQTCTSDASTCPQADSIIASIRYVDWSGVNWTASRLGNTFTSTKASPASTDIDCPANATTGVSPGTDFSACKSYASKTIPITDAEGNHIMAGISAYSRPDFTSARTLVFSPGTPSTATITAAGNPTPSICPSSGTLPNLPSDFTFTGGLCGKGSLTLAFNGDINAAQQVYPLALQAANSFATISQTFSVNVATQLNIISPGTLNATAGVPVNFTVIATGNPTPKLSSNEFPLAGLNFKDNGDGTATISGVVPFPQQTFCIMPCSIGVTATNSQGSVTQYLQVNAGSPPLANLLPPTSATFYTGVANQVLLNSNGAITPVSWGYVQNVNTPTPWLSLKDNGDGTAWLTGTPPVGTSGTFYPSIGPGAAYTLEVINPFPVTVEDVPIITSPYNLFVTVATPASFSAAATQGAVALGVGTPLPSGLSFTSGSAASISGTPAVGTGGQYQVALNDNAGAAGSTSQPLTIDVWEAPQITSSNTATFFVGMPSSFAVTTTGFPNLSTHPLEPNSQPPTSPTDGDGMVFTVNGLPPDLQFSNLNPQGLLTGTLTIQGAPSLSDVGLHQVSITAQNGVGAAAQQTLMLDIVEITATAPASGATCNGNYNGTFKGTVTVSAGQNCSFVGGGGITGNVTVHGGSLALANAKITGNVSITGGSAFSLGQASEVTGNLAIQNVASGSTTNQICGAKLDGNVQISTNATPIQIGSLSDSSCVSNFFGGNVEVNANTGAVTIYNNSVEDNLSCSNNTSITGGGNAARKENGQCAHF